MYITVKDLKKLIGVMKRMAAVPLPDYALFWNKLQEHFQYGSGEVTTTITSNMWILGFSPFLPAISQRLLALIPTGALSVALVSPEFNHNGDPIRYVMTQAITAH